VKQPFITNLSTLELLKSSVLISISGAFRVYLAAILLQAEVSIITCLASGLIIYSVYTLDRTLGSEEDVINRSEFAGSKREIGFMVTVLSFLWGAYLFSKRGLLVFAFLPFVTGFLYSKGITIGKFTLKLKGGLGVKNTITGFTWGLSIAGVAGHGYNNILPVVLVFLFFGIKLFINSTIYDFKDMKGDYLAGIKTLPACLGARKTRSILLILHIITHLCLVIGLIKGVIGFEPIIILYSFLCGLICIHNYTKKEEDETEIQKTERTFFIEWESVIVTGFVLLPQIL